MTAVAGSVLLLSRSSPLRRLSGVPSLPSPLPPLLPLSSSTSSLSGQEKRPRPRHAVEDGLVIRLQSWGRCCCCQPRRPHAPSSPFCICSRPNGWPWPIPQHVLWPDGIIVVDRCHCPRQQRRCRTMMTTAATKTQRQQLVLPRMPPTTIVTCLKATDKEFCKLPPRCFLGVSLMSSPFAASPEVDVAAFVIDKTALPACTRICWGGL